MKKIILLLLFAALVSCGDNRKSVPVTTQMACQNAVNSSLSSAKYKAGVSVAVFSGKYDAWTYAAGKASEGVAMSSSTSTFAFSITKTVLSALILKQIENSSYTLSSKARDLLSASAVTAIEALSNASAINLDVTVAELLSHTSGMKDYATNSKPDVDKIKALASSSLISCSPVDILSLVPGPYDASKLQSYSSTNYILLGMIAEKQGNDDLNNLVSKTFFKELGISAVIASQDDPLSTIPASIAGSYDQYELLKLIDADLWNEYHDLVENILGKFGDVAWGVSFAGSQLKPAVDLNLNALTSRASWAAGGIIATADNLAKWGYELYSSDGAAVTSSIRDQLKGSVSGDADYLYGYGISKTKFTYSDGTEGYFYGHSGDGPGGKTILAYDPDLDMSIAIIMNASANYTAITNYATNSSTSDAALGLVDRKELVRTIFSTFKAAPADSQ